MAFHIIIPARYASSRLPHKLLQDLAGKPVLWHTYQRACASSAATVTIATDDERIRAAAEQFGAKVLITAAAHQSGTDRLAEAADIAGFCDTDIVVNVQGDEPLLPSKLIDQVAHNLAAQPLAAVATLCHRIHSVQDLFDPNIVKVVMDSSQWALYFSRAPIPWHRDAFARDKNSLPAETIFHRHIGLYAYRVGLLRQFTTWPPCALEKTESLEQLRVLWHGQRIHVAEACAENPPGIDTAADLQKARDYLAGRT